MGAAVTRVVVSQMLTHFIQTEVYPELSHYVDSTAKPVHDRNVKLQADVDKLSAQVTILSDQCSAAHAEIDKLKDMVEQKSMKLRTKEENPLRVHPLYSAIHAELIDVMTHLVLVQGDENSVLPATLDSQNANMRLQQDGELDSEWITVWRPDWKETVKFPKNAEYLKLTTDKVVAYISHQTVAPEHPLPDDLKKWVRHLAHTYFNTMRIWFKAQNGPKEKQKQKNQAADHKIKERLRQKWNRHVEAILLLSEWLEEQGLDTSAIDGIECLVNQGYMSDNCSYTEKPETTPEIQNFRKKTYSSEKTGFELLGVVWRSEFLTELYHCLDQLSQECGDKKQSHPGLEHTKPSGARKAGKAFEPRFMCDPTRANWDAPAMAKFKNEWVHPFEKLVNPKWLAMKANMDFKTCPDDLDLCILQFDIKKVFKLDCIHDELTLKLTEADYAKKDTELSVSLE